jgi:hypothetical protein
MEVVKFHWRFKTFVPSTLKNSIYTGEIDTQKQQRISLMFDFCDYGGPLAEEIKRPQSGVTNWGGKLLHDES